MENKLFFRNQFDSEDDNVARNNGLSLKSYDMEWKIRILEHNLEHQKRINDQKLLDNYELQERLKKQKRANALLTSENDSQKEFQQILELKIKELEDSRQKERINYTLTLKTVCNMISGNFEIEDRVKSSNMMQNSTYSQTDDIYSDSLPIENEHVNIAAIMRSLRELDKKMDILLSDKKTALVELNKNMKRELHGEVASDSINMVTKRNRRTAENCSKPEPLATAVTSQGTDRHVTVDQVAIPPPPPPPMPTPARPMPTPARPVPTPLPRPTPGAPASAQGPQNYPRLAVTPDLLRTVALRPMAERKLKKYDGKTVASAAVVQAKMSSKNDSIPKPNRCPDDICVQTGGCPYESREKTSDDNDAAVQTKNSTDSQKLVMPNFPTTTPEDENIIDPHTTENDTRNTYGKSKSRPMPDMPSPPLPGSMFGHPEDETFYGQTSPVRIV